MNVRVIMLVFETDKRIADQQFWGGSRWQRVLEDYYNVPGRGNDSEALGRLWFFFHGLAVNVDLFLLNKKAVALCVSMKQYSYGTVAAALLNNSCAHQTIFVWLPEKKKAAF